MFVQVTHKHSLTLTHTNTRKERRVRQRERRRGRPPAAISVACLTASVPFDEQCCMRRRDAQLGMPAVYVCVCVCLSCRVADGTDGTVTAAVMPVLVVCVCMSGVSPTLMRR